MIFEDLIVKCMPFGGTTFFNFYEHERMNTEMSGGFWMYENTELDAFNENKKRYDKYKKYMPYLEKLSGPIPKWVESYKEFGPDLVRTLQLRKGETYVCESSCLYRLIGINKCNLTSYVSILLPNDKEYFISEFCCLRTEQPSILRNIRDKILNGITDKNIMPIQLRNAYMDKGDKVVTKMLP